MKRLYDYRCFTGNDTDLTTSLFEYGLIWKQIGRDYKFIYGVVVDKAGTYKLFDYAFMPIDTNIKEEYAWVDLPSVLSFVGMTEKGWLAMTLPQKISDLISYYGVEEIFGSAYTFEIRGNESV